MILPSTHEIFNHFTAYLLESGLSNVSIKNYLSDARHFLRFLEANHQNDLDKVFQNISDYTSSYVLEQKTNLTPLATTNRRLASIRRLSTFLQHHYNLMPNQNQETSIETSKQHSDNPSTDLSTKKILDQFRQQLQNENKTSSTVKNYLSDLYHYFNWIANQTPFNTHHLEQILNKEQLQGFITFQKLCHTSSSVISRRQSSIKKLTHFCFAQGYIPQDPFEIIVQPLKLKPLAWLTRLIPKAKTDQNAPKGRLAVIYHKYNSLSFTPYFHLALLVLATTTMAFLFYNQVIKQAKPSSAATALTPPKRQLSFQGRLTDSAGTPITTSINVNFKLWNHLSAGSQLYTTGTCSVVPDTNGIFNSLIGDGVCGSEIAQSVFADNRDVYLEVTVGSETLTPRQQIATVGYALNSETLQGYPASAAATINTVPVVDNSGNINIAVTSPSLISTSGNFNIKGQALSLTTATNSGGDIVFQPDALGSGQILALGGTTTEDSFRVTNANLTTGSLIAGYIGNDTATSSGRLLSLSGGATETDRFYVGADGSTKINTATNSSGISALIINQNTVNGNLLSASASSTAKFTINNTGSITLIDGVAHTIDDVSGDLNLNSAGGDVVLGSGDNLQITAAGNLIFGTTTSLAETTAANDSGAYLVGAFDEFTYSSSSNVQAVLNDLDAAIAGISVGAGYWDQQNGALYPNNSTVDFLLGGQASTSAKFAVLNINSGTPTASVSAGVAGATFLAANGFLSTTDRQSLTIGNSSTYNSTGNLLLHPNGYGYVGIGTTSPTALLETNASSALLSESLTNTSLTGGTSWTQSGDMALAANAATYTHSAGSGTLSQAAGTLAIAGNSNRLYSFTYTISAVSGTAPTATITTAYATVAQTLTTSANGTYTLVFRSTTSPGAFTISVTSGATGAFTIDDISLKEVSGNILAKTTGTGDQLTIMDGRNNTNLLLADSGVTTFKPTSFDSVLSCVGASCTSADTGTFTDNTTEAKSNLGSDFSSIDTGTTATFYLGLDHPFNTINFDINTVSSGLTLVKEYYNGSAWTALPEVTDNTSSLTADGTITFTLPSDWTTNSVNSLSKYWVRLRSSTSVATAPTIYFSTPTTGNRFYIYGQSGDALPTVFVSDKGNLGVGDATPVSLLSVGSGDLFQVNSSGIVAAIEGVAHTIDDDGGNLSLTSNGTSVNIADDLAVNGATSADITSTTTTATLFDTTVLSLSLGSASTTLNLGAGGSLTRDINLGTGTGVDTIHIGDGGTGADVITIGSTNAGNVSIKSNAILNLTGGTSSVIDFPSFDVDSSGNILKINNVATSFPASQGVANSTISNDGAGNLTWINPVSTGISTYWQRLSGVSGGGVLAPTNITDSLNVGAIATSSAIVHLGGTSGEKSFFIEPVAMGFSGAMDANAFLEVDGSIFPHADDSYDLGDSNHQWSDIFLKNSLFLGNTATITLQTAGNNHLLTNGQWNATSTLRVGDSTDGMPTGPMSIEFYVAGDATVSGSLGALGNAYIGGAAEIIGNVTVGGGAGKMDVGTVDPPYTINGEKYATYLSGMIGVKEEVTGSLTTDEYLEGIGYRKTINFSQQTKGSDLWLFSQTTNLKDNLNRLSVLLTPQGQARTWYELDKNKNTLYVYASSPSQISFRFTAPRFDDASWTNTRASGSDGFIINNTSNLSPQTTLSENIIYPSQIENIDGVYKLFVNNQEKNEIANFSSSLIANLKSGLAIISELVTDNLTVNTRLISPLADIGELTVNNATVSGNLYADNIKGKTIDKLSEQLGLLDEKYSTASAILTSLQDKYSTYENNLLQLSPLASTSASLPSDLTLNSLNTESIITTDLLANSSIFTQSLSSFEADLFIQPSGDKPVHILANLMTLYPNGQVAIEGDLIVTGNIFANNIDTRTATVSGSLAITGGLIIASENSSTASISGQTSSNSTVGTATIATGSAEIVIANTNITSDSLVYITPVSDTDNQVLYVKSKEVGVGFTVAVPQPVAKETSFNFWLVQTN